MKTTPLQLIGCGLAILSTVGSLQAQGLVSFNNRVIGTVVAPVYGQEPSDATIAKTGNTSSGTPAGSTTYGGALLSGAGYTAELWGGPVGTPDGGLSQLAVTTFRTGGFAGFVVVPGSAVSVPGVGAGSQARLQLRVFDNQGGTVPSWLAAQAFPTTVASGFSPSFTSPVLGDGGAIPTPSLAGLVSFNIHLSAPSQLNIDWWTVDGGGDTSTNGQFSVSGTIGQPDAGGPMTGGGFSLTGGYWALYALQSPGAPLLSIQLTTTNTAMVYWPSPSTGWTLQENTDSISSGNWNDHPFPQDNGTIKYIIVNPPSGRRFYRLKSP